MSPTADGKLRASEDQPPITEPYSSKHRFVVWVAWVAWQTVRVGVLAVSCLGPLQLSRGGRPLLLASRRSRIVLVVLALSARQTVPVERLISAAWADDDLPKDPRSSLHSLMSRLRASVGVGLIETEAAGYRLTIDPDDVDVLRFLRLLQNLQEADAKVVDEALGLWRGTPFVDLTAPWLDRFELPKLVERYLAAVERRADLAFESDDAASQLPRLNLLATRYPLREPLLARLLLAFDQVGRSAEALQRYEVVRAELADALGVDPGRELQAVHAQLLRRTTAGAGSRLPPPAPDGPAPRQLPAAVSVFVGRADALAQLDALLPADDTDVPEVAVISAIAGAAGVGKTTLAMHWAHRVSDRFPDGQLYINLRGFDPAGQVIDPADAVRGFLDALGVPPERIPADPESRAGLYRSVLAGKRMLVVLDNARDADQVRPLLPGSAGCLALVTSRNQLFSLVASEAASLITIDLLSLVEARQLLALRIGSERVAAEPDATDEVIGSCARLPLALAIVAARSVTRRDLPLAALAAELRDTHRRLDALTGDHPSTDVRAVFSWSYRTLSHEAARLFRLLSLHPGTSMSASAAASLAAVSLPQVNVLLTELTRAHLTVEDDQGRYSFHDLLRVYAADLAHHHDAGKQRTAATRRILDWYLHTAFRAAVLISPQRARPEVPPIHDGVVLEPLTDNRAALSWLATERPALPSVLARMAAAELHAATLLCTWSVSVFLDRQGRWTDLIAISQAGLTAATRSGNQREQARTHRNLALAFVGLDRLDEANHQLQTALRLYGELDDAAGIAHTRSTLCRVFDLQKNFEEALEQAKLAHKFFQIAGHEAGEVATLNNIGWYQALQGKYREALTTTRAAHEWNIRSGDRLGQSSTWDSFGYILHHLGHHQFAIGCFLRALDILVEFGDRYFQTLTLDRLGDTYTAAGDHEAATAVWQQALTILDELGHADADTIRAKLPIQP